MPARLPARTHGTLVRLRMAPLTRAQILGGKALACFVAILIVEVMLPCAILAGIGLACVAIGTRGLKDA